VTSLLAIGGAAALLVGLFLFSWAAASPRGLVRRTLHDYLSWLGSQLQNLHAQVSPTRVLVMQVAATIGLLIGGSAISGYLFLAAPLPLALTRWGLRLAERKRTDAIEAQLGGWLVALANSLKVSGSIVDSMAQTLEMTRPPLAQELDRTVKEVRFGASVEAALRDLASRVQSPMLAAAVTTLVIGRRTGGALPTLLERTAGVTRERQRLERVFRQQLSSARIQFQGLALGPPLMIAGLDQMQPGFFDPLLQTSIGNMIAVVCGVLYMVAILLARRIMALVI
jgi:tight adherence protein B